MKKAASFKGVTVDYRVPGFFFDGFRDTQKRVFKIDGDTLKLYLDCKFDLIKLAYSRFHRLKVETL